MSSPGEATTGPEPPAGRPGADPAARATSATSRSRLLATVAVLAGAALVLVAESRSWVTVPISGVPGRHLVSADGRLTAPGTGALALVAGAGALAMAVAGRWTRLVIAALLLLAGLASAALAVAVLQAPADAVRPAVATATGTVGRLPDGRASATAWPVLSTVGALIITNIATAISRCPILAGNMFQPSTRVRRNLAGPPDHPSACPGQPVVMPGRCPSRRRLT